MQAERQTLSSLGLVASRGGMERLGLASQAQLASVVANSGGKSSIIAMAAGAVRPGVASGA